MFDEFRRHAEAVGAEVRLVPTRTAALQVLEAILMTEGPALWAAGVLLKDDERAALAGRVPNLSFDVTRETAAAARVGISEMDGAIAATGTLFQDASAIGQRLVSTLPEIHIALLDTSKIVADLGAALRAVDPRRAAYLAFISGPSRTADIERVLTIGVHGPKRLIIVAIEALS
jgi:L-lactate dehydrogenase complex protein LldG